jgi:hypothetical protein
VFLLELSEVTPLIGEIEKAALSGTRKAKGVFVKFPYVHIIGGVNPDAEGYSLGIKKEFVNEASLRLLESIADRNGLKMVSLDEGYFLMYSPKVRA